MFGVDRGKHEHRLGVIEFPCDGLHRYRIEAVGLKHNGQRISGPTPLSNGDMIGCGNSKVRFQEKARR